MVLHLLPLLNSLGSFELSCCLLAHCRNLTSLSIFHRHYFCGCSFELAQLVLLPYSRGKSTRYSDRFHGISVTISRCYMDVYVKSFFPRTARFWKSLPIERFSLIYDINGLTDCRLRFPLCFNLFVFLFLVTPCLVVAVQPCLE